MKNLQIKIKFTLTLLAVTGSVFLSENAKAARGRPYINAAKTTFVSDTGTLLRGPILGSSLSLITSITNSGCNAVHMYAESAGGGAAGYNSNYVDAVVKATKTNNLYLILTIGGGGVNLNFATNFWNIYAPRYANETHVIYEIQNEPTSSQPSSAAVINLETNCYKLIRAKAPNTPILLFSYEELSSNAGVLQDLTNVSSVVNWANAAVAFHGYGAGGANLMNTHMQNILANGYPCFQTEFYRWPWGLGNFALASNESMYQDVSETGYFERAGVSWLTFITPSNFTNTTRFIDRINKAGIVWTPDYGTWPSGSRYPYGNGNAPWWTTNLTSTIRIEAENFDHGGEGISYHDTGAGNAGGVYRTSYDVDMETTTDTGGGYDVGWIVGGEWLEYTVYINDPGFYDVKLRVASPQATNQLSVSFFGTNVTGTVTFAGTGGYQAWTTITNTVFLTPGQQIMRVSAITSGYNLNWIELSAVNTGNLANGTYKIVNRYSGKAMEVAGAATTNGAPVDQLTYAASSNQKWVFTHKGGNQYTVTSVQTGKAIDEASYTSWSGDYIHMYTSSGTPNQRYIPMPTSSGYYSMLNVNSGLALEVVGSSTADGAIIDQGEYVNHLGEQWSFGTP